jgi:hypothetical protein
MAKYAILRVQKLKSLVSVRRSFKHSYREQDTPNADPSLLEENQLFGAQNTKQAMAKFKARLPEKLRKNGVLCVEHLVTASPEWFENKSQSEQVEYFNDSITYIKHKWGADNVICGGVHRDETTPHMFVYVIPKDESTGKLNCRKWLGEKSALTDLQDDFFNKVGRTNGLERGIKGSKAKHKSIKQYYTELSETEKASFNSKYSITKSDLALAATIGSSKVEDALKMANRTSTLNNEVTQIKKQSSEQIKSLTIHNEYLKKKNITLDTQNQEVKSIEKMLQIAQRENEALTHLVSGVKGDKDKLEGRVGDLQQELKEAKMQTLQLRQEYNPANKKDEDSFSADLSHTILVELD